MPSKRICPWAPEAAQSLALQIETLAAGTRLTRFFRRTPKGAAAYPANSFNPNIGKDWRVAEQGARFNPFPDGDGSNVPSLYAASSYAAAALESVFHDVPHEKRPKYPRALLAAWQWNLLLTQRPLQVFVLTNPHLRELKVARRRESLWEDELIHTPPSQYPRTRSWARLLHDSVPALDGLAWRPRLAGEGWAYVFFGDRCSSADFSSPGSPATLDGRSERRRMQRVADEASIELIGE